MRPEECLINKNIHSQVRKRWWGIPYLKWSCLLLWVLVRDKKNQPFLRNSPSGWTFELQKGANNKVLWEVEKALGWDMGELYLIFDSWASYFNSWLHFPFPLLCLPVLLKGEPSLCVYTVSGELRFAVTLLAAAIFIPVAAATHPMYLGVNVCPGVC